ncbi:glycosyltransferase [Candidatus Omnitrophota bacterium]
MKNILFLHDNLEAGGAEQLRLSLLKTIDRDQYDVRVCCISRRGMIGEKIQRLGFPVDELGLDPHPKNIFTTFRIIKYLRQQKIDILHTCLFNANLHGRIAGYLCRIPRMISEIHGQHYEFKGLRYLPHLFAERLLFRLSDAIICCSERSREDIIKQERLSPERVIAITNCIDPSLYQLTQSRNSLREKLGIGDEPALITVASFWKMKGHIYLLEALSELKRQGYVFKWICAGDGPLKENIRSSCLDLGLAKETVFLGRVSNIADYLNASDLFILPSLSEALPIALLEAMYMGLPCIVTDVGFNKELIKENVNGIVIKPRDKEGLKRAIIFCFKNKELIKAFGCNNKAKVEKEYLLSDNYTRRFYEIWEN